MTQEKENDKSLASLALNFMLREVKFHNINTVMGEIADNGIIETSKEVMEQMLTMFDDYRDSSITFRESVVEFLERTKNAPDLTDVLNGILEIDERHLDVINEVDEKLEYFVNAAIKKSEADRLKEQIDYFLENPDGNYNPDGQETEQEEPTQDELINDEIKEFEKTFFNKEIEPESEIKINKLDVDTGEITEEPRLKVPEQNNSEMSDVDKIKQFEKIIAEADSNGSFSETDENNPYLTETDTDPEAEAEYYRQVYKQKMAEKEVEPEQEIPIYVEEEKEEPILAEKPRKKISLKRKTKKKAEKKHRMIWKKDGEEDE